MSLKIGINGFGRIGRLVFRSAVKQKDINIIGINDLLEVNHLAYMLKYDSVHGPFDGSIEVINNNLVVDGNQVMISAEKNPENISWSNKVDVMAECTGLFTSLEMAQTHLNAGAKKVVISAPSKDAPMFVMGVNHISAKSSDKIVSNASCTTNCLAPIAKVLNDNGFKAPKRNLPTLLAKILGKFDKQLSFFLKDINILRVYHSNNARDVLGFKFRSSESAIIDAATQIKKLI